MKAAPRQDYYPSQITVREYNGTEYIYHRLYRNLGQEDQRDTYCAYRVAKKQRTENSIEVYLPKENENGR